jgi:hypothetical protein
LALRPRLSTDLPFRPIRIVNLTDQKFIVNKICDFLLRNRLDRGYRRALAVALRPIHGCAIVISKEA